MRGCHGLFWDCSQDCTHDWSECTSTSAKWEVMLRNFTLPVIWWAFMWCSFQFHEILGHPGASRSGAAFGSVMIFISMKNFHYLSGVNMQPFSGLTLCQYTCVQSLWNQRIAYFKVRHFLHSMHIDFLLAVDVKKDNNFFCQQKSGRENNVERKITWSRSRYFSYFLPWHDRICALHTFIGKLTLFLSKICMSKMLTELLAHWMDHHTAFGKALARDAKLHFLLSKSTTWINITNHHC